MPTYLFASMRGNDFESAGDSPEDAYIKLLDREKDEGSLWKLSDPYRNQWAIQHQGYTKLGKEPFHIAYKVKE